MFPSSHIKQVLSLLRQQAMFFPRPQVKKKNFKRFLSKVRQAANSLTHCYDNISLAIKYYITFFLRMKNEMVIVASFNGNKSLLQKDIHVLRKNIPEKVQ